VPETAPETGEATPEATPEEPSLEGIILASDLIGQTIQLTSGQEIGSVQDLVIDVSNGQVTYVLLSPGEDLGLGENVIPVPIQTLRRNAETLAFQLEIDQDALQNAPNFNLEDLTGTTSQDWVEALSEFWESVQTP
jgi:sporulation protein YlmC with PRC-barrel domain